MVTDVRCFVRVLVQLDIVNHADELWVTTYDSEAYHAYPHGINSFVKVRE